MTPDPCCVVAAGLRCLRAWVSRARPELRIAGCHGRRPPKFIRNRARPIRAADGHCYRAICAVNGVVTTDERGHLGSTTARGDMRLRNRGPRLRRRDGLRWGRRAQVSAKKNGRMLDSPRRMLATAPRSQSHMQGGIGQPTRPPARSSSARRLSDSRLERAGRTIGKGSLGLRRMTNGTSPTSKPRSRRGRRWCVVQELGKPRPRRRARAPRCFALDAGFCCMSRDCNERFHGFRRHRGLSRPDGPIGRAPSGRGR